MNPIYVCARTKAIAEEFVATVLQQNPAHLRYVNASERLYGLSGILLYVHPSANHSYEYERIIRVARERGCVFANIDDFFFRQHRSNFTYRAPK